MEDTRRPFKVDITSFLVLSLVTHMLLLVTYIPNTSKIKLSENVKPIKIKIQNLQTNSDKTLRQIVETSESKNKNNKKADYLGKTNTAFDRQTRAKNTGIFKKAGAGAKDGTKDQTASPRVVKSKSKLKNIKFSDLAVSNNFAPKSYNKPKPGQKLGLSNGDAKEVGLGRSSDFVKDIPLGDFTKLNTQEKLVTCETREISPLER